jgi:hypothetical protein
MATSEFGALDEVAPGYQTELALVQGRRTAGLLLVMPLLVVMWDLVWWFKPATGGPAPPAAVLFGRLWDGIALLCLAGAVVAVAATGRALPRVRAPRRVARLTGIAALAAGDGGGRLGAGGGAGPGADDRRPDRLAADGGRVAVLGCGHRCHAPLGAALPGRRRGVILAQGCSGWGVGARMWPTVAVNSCQASRSAASARRPAGVSR